MSNDEHYGVGFAISNTVAMDDGISVVAAAKGTVSGTRDTMPDINLDDLDPAVIKGKECGNGVRIDHGNGWATQYCHLKLGSVTVRTGQQVEAGDKLGQVGLSGNTNHPHVFLSVSKDGKKIDPYTGIGIGIGTGERACGDTSGSLWNAETASAFPYRTGLIRDAFFTHEVPDIRAVKAGTAARDSGPTDLPELVLWTRTIGTLHDHRISMTIKAPGGLNLVNKVYTESKLYAVVGVRARRPQIHWPAGVYSGAIRISNAQGQITDTRRVTIEIK